MGRDCRQGGGLSKGELRASPREPCPTHLLEGTITVNTEARQTLSRVLGFMQPNINQVASCNLSSRGHSRGARSTALSKVKDSLKVWMGPGESPFSVLLTAYISLASRASPSSLWPTSLSNLTGRPIFYPAAQSLTDLTVPPSGSYAYSTGSAVTAQNGL